MKICILTPRFPVPENGGDVLRINNIARYLKKKNYEVVLCSFYDKESQLDALPDAEKIYDKIFLVKRNKLVSLLESLRFFLMGQPIQCGYYYSKTFLKILKKVLKDENPNLIISHLIRMVTYLEKLKLEEKSIIEMTDALSKTYKLASNSKSLSAKKIIYSIEKKLIKKYEQHVIHTFKKVVLVSEADIDYLGKTDSLSFHTNGIDIYKNTSGYDVNKICFVGNMRTLQNQEAVSSFIRNIFPLIKKQNPNAQFHIVGAEPPAFIKDMANSKDIFVTGFVNSVEEYIKDSCVLVAPVTIAAGIQNKVLIGMACRIPVILTPLIAGAISGIKSGENCFIENDYVKFAEKCLLLMNDKEERLKIVENGLELVKDNYSWYSKLDGYEII